MVAEEQKLEQTILLGAQLMVDNGLGGWKIQLQNKRTTLADCHRGEKTIRYSKHFLKVTDRDQFIGVTFHEIAHALVGDNHNHDSVFRMKCRELGANENYIGCKAKGVTIPRKYNLTCPECGATSRANVRKNYICSNCKNGGKSVSFRYAENIQEVIMW